MGSVMWLGHVPSLALLLDKLFDITEFQSIFLLVFIAFLRGYYEPLRAMFVLQAVVDTIMCYFGLFRFHLTLKSLAKT